MKVDKLVWMVAVAMAGALAMSGFEGQSLKFASCDVEKVFDNSTLFKANSDELATYQHDRATVLKFIVTNHEMPTQDAKDYADLALKKDLSAADKTRLDAIKANAEAQAQRHKELSVKSNPTADDQTSLSNFAGIIQANNALLQDLDQTYSAQVQAERTRLQSEALEKVRKTIRDIATKQGYNIVFSTDAAPFAANNITDEALTAVNKS